MFIGHSLGQDTTNVVLIVLSHYIKPSGDYAGSFISSQPALGEPPVFAGYVFAVQELRKYWLNALCSSEVQALGLLKFKCCSFANFWVKSNALAKYEAYPLAAKWSAFNHDIHTC